MRSKSIDEMNYEEMVAERQRVIDAIERTRSIHLKNDYAKYLHKINVELMDYRKFQLEAKERKGIR